MRHRHGITWLKLMAFMMALALVVAACSSDAGEETFEEIGADLSGGFAPETTAAQAATTTTVAAEDREAPGAGTDANQLGTGGIVPAVFQPADLGRDIIFTADLTVAVTDVATAGEEATRIIQRLGGFLFGQRTTGSPQPVSVLTFKVLPEDFQEALDQLGSIGEIRTQNVSASDVTERIVDLQSRINTAEASVERLRALLAEATQITTIVELENELLQRETQLETLRGQLRTLEDQVALATIVLTITEAAARPAVALGVTAYRGHDDGIACPGSSGLTVDQTDEVTVCFEITNTGDTLLKDFELRDPVLDLAVQDLIVLFGDLGATIEPGESIVVALETVAERSIRTQTTVTATPVDEDGNPLTGRTAANTVTTFIQAVSPGGIPSFSEGLSASWELLVNFVRLLIVFAGAIIPFIWVPLAVWFVWRLVKRRREEQAVPVPSGNPGPAPGANPEPAEEAGD